MKSIVFVSVILNILCHASGYRIGVGRADITGPPAEVNFMGYANIKQRGAGIHLRQFARAFVIEDDEQNVLVFVNADVGMIGEGVRKAVLRKVTSTSIFAGKITKDNLILSGTHTHSGPGGYLMDFLFDISCLGYADETFRAIVDGIYRAIDIAAAETKMEEGRIYLSTGQVFDSNINRSPTAYENNPEAEKQRYSHNVDKTMYQLKFVAKKNNHPMGVINWFPVHPTSMKNTNTLISSDNVGYASILFEEHIDPGQLPGHSSFVAAFASSNLGDASPNTKGAKCVGSDKDCDADSSTCEGKSQKCVADGPGRDMFESTKIIATNLFQGAKRLFDQVNENNDTMREVLGKIASVHQHVDMTAQEITIKDKEGNLSTIKGCYPAMGYSFAAGTTDGPGAFSFVQGTTKETSFWRTLRNALKEPTTDDIECHKPKPILLATGRMTSPYDWQPKILSTQIAIIGDVVIAALPGEFTTMSGRRMREQLQEVAKNSRKLGQEPTIILAGLCNTYTDYITTFEEYQIQRYEGASTIYGPHTLSIHLQLYKDLLRKVIANEPVSPGPPPKDLSQQQISFVPPVILDLPERNCKFGDCVVQPPSEGVQIGDTVHVEFISGHPRNRLNGKIRPTFLEVLMQTSTGWKAVANDANWETKFLWRRTYLASSRVSIEWEITDRFQPGLYRIVHYGLSHSLLNGAAPYSGETNTFAVRSPTYGPPIGGHHQ